MRTLAFFLPLAATGFGCGSHVYYDLERDLDPQGCGEPGYLVIAGTVDGAPVQIYDQFFQATFAPGAIGTSKDSPNDEGVVLVPETQFPCGAMAPDCPNVYGGSTASAAAMVNLSLDGGGTTIWLCDADHPTVTFSPLGSPEAQTIDVASTLASLRNLGSCPGAPVDAKLTSSIGPLAGVLNGTSFESAIVMPIVYPSPHLGYGDAVLAYQGGGALLWETGTAQREAGVILMAAGSPDPGAVYCFDGPDYAWGSAGPSVVPNLTRLGTCAEAPPVKGSLSVCAALGQDPY
jgi:hypothetical protein